MTWLPEIVARTDSRPLFWPVDFISYGTIGWDTPIGVLTEYLSGAAVQIGVKPTDRMTVPTDADWEMLATYFVALNA